jgi:uncharacterized membrane protein
MSTTIEESVELDVPVHTAYNQWTQFEDFPRFLTNVESVQQIDDRRLRWRAKVGGKVQDWEAEITEQAPDKRIAWRSISGAKNAGVLTFHRLSDTRSKVMLQLEYDPQGFLENVGDAVGVGRVAVKKSLHQFKEFIEKRGRETGAWRGEIPGPDDVRAPLPRPTQPQSTRAEPRPGPE